MTEISDAEFTLKLRSYLGQFKDGHKPVVPLIKNPDGSINRVATLALPCYQNFKDVPLTSDAPTTLEQ